MFKAIKEFFLGKAPEAPKEEVPAEAPYKVESPAPVVEPAPVAVSAPVAEPAPVAPAKKPRNKKPGGQGAPKKGGRKPKAPQA